MGSEPIKPRVPNNSLPVSASPLFTRRCLCLTVGALLRFRAYWAPCGSGRYEVTLDVAHEDQTITRHRLFLASQPNHFGGRRYYLICPACGRRACALYCVRGEFRCRKCTRLRYVSKTWRKDWRLTHHYADLVEALRHRPGPKPVRYFRYSFWSDLHCARGLLRLSRQLDAIDARRRRKGLIPWVGPTRGRAAQGILKARSFHQHHLHDD